MSVWFDRSKVTKRTADLLRQRMKRCKALLYASSPSAPSSLWMPWETGYFDGHLGRVAILPVFESDPHDTQFRGQEYLASIPTSSRKEPLRRKQVTLWVHEDENTYVSAAKWLEGKRPYKGS